MRPRASHPTGRSAVQTPSSERPVPLQLPRARAVALMESVANAAAAASVTPDRAISGAHAERRETCAVPLKLPRAREAAWIKSVADAAAAASVAPDSAISGADTEQRAACAAQASKSEPVPLKLPRAREAALIGSVADAAAAASVTPKRAISGARAEQRAACAAQASESESGSFDRERCRCCCGGERRTRLGDQRCSRRAASGLCRPSFRERERQR
jgi:hypothetical protein